MVKRSLQASLPGTQQAKQAFEYKGWTQENLHYLGDKRVINTVCKKKILNKTSQKPSNHNSSYTGIGTQNGGTDPSGITKKYSINPVDRDRVIVFIDGSNLFYAASDLEIEIDY
jgi:hypothetical protein